MVDSNGWLNTTSDCIQQVPKRKSISAAHHRRFNCIAEFLSEFIPTVFNLMFRYFYMNALYKKQKYKKSSLNIVVVVIIIVVVVV